MLKRVVGAHMQRNTIKTAKSWVLLAVADKISYIFTAVLALIKIEGHNL